MTHKIVAKYIKNYNFNIPSPKVFFLLSKDISNYKINLDIKSKEFKKHIIEIDVTLSLTTNDKSFDKINSSITYAAIVEVSKDVPKDKLERIILIEIPSQVYEDLRKAFIFSFESSGFKDIKIDKEINFEELFNKRKTNNNFS